MFETKWDLAKIWTGNAGFGLLVWISEGRFAELNMEHCFRSFIAQSIEDRVKLHCRRHCININLAQGGSEKFAIQRCVRPTHALIPLLRNAVLEHALRKWKLKLTNKVVRLGQNSGLTNVRCANDLMIFATSREEFALLGGMMARREPALIGYSQIDRKRRLCQLAHRFFA